MPQSIKIPSYTLQRDLLDIFKSRLSNLKNDIVEEEIPTILNKQATTLLIDIKQVAECFTLNEELENTFNRLINDIIVIINKTKSSYKKMHTLH